MNNLVIAQVDENKELADVELEIIDDPDDGQNESVDATHLDN